ncbi:hypothetical protein BJ138DRAFT_1151359 [Hygrophoropsis aurantiaca]|uniref:Uncharacterized protein n=1 Tax=Hygrophoropsis aurantiaca TaxID=72124 RepID=A0ACB8AEE9_9AGAM|nr:hypothetical protein BJ138DRAFT_1151359 [Hygrophoropsis aurantiaca]
MTPIRIPASCHYICFALAPSCCDALTIRKALQDSLTQMFGVTSSTYIDILSINEDGTQVVVRVGEKDAPKLMAAVVSSSASPKFSLIKESPFLPSLLATNVSF